MTQHYKMDVLQSIFNENIEFVDIKLCDSAESLHSSIWNLFLQSIVHLIGNDNSFVLSCVTDEVVEKITVAFRKLHIEVQITDIQKEFTVPQGMVKSELSSHIKVITAIQKKIRFVFFQGGQKGCSEGARCH